jgi:hypothetical protein
LSRGRFTLALRFSSSLKRFLFRHTIPPKSTIDVDFRSS